MNYKVPIDFYGFFQRIELSKNKKRTRFQLNFPRVVDEKTSIDQFLELIVFTHPGECKFAYDFGFSFWETEFSNISVDSFNSNENPRKKFEENLKKTIVNFEPRLDNIKVDIHLSQSETVIHKMKIKYLVTIKIQAVIKGIQPKPYQKTIAFSMGPVVKK
jgi:hypothetical protein